MLKHITHNCFISLQNNEYPISKLLKKSFRASKHGNTTRNVHLQASTCDLIHTDLSKLSKCFQNNQKINLGHTTSIDEGVDQVGYYIYQLHHRV